MVPFHSALKRRRSLLCGGLALLLSISTAAADDIAGEFDFYVLALSWSPSYCAIESSPDEAQCGVERHGFIVHGLWPQYEHGYPEYCPSDMSTRVSRAAVERVMDVMPSVGLIRYQWRKHGICTGLRQRDYFELTRNAFAQITVPRQFASPSRDRSISPEALESAFITANPGLKAGGIAVTCKERHLADVRICLTKDLDFRSCREVDRDACRSSRISMPAIQ